MLDALNRAERSRDLAEEYRRLAGDWLPQQTFETAICGSRDVAACSLKPRKLSTLACGG
jgi:hypothetical protein